MRIKIPVVFVMLLFLSSCFPMIQQPQTPVQKLAYAKATITGVNNGVAELLRNKVISLSTAREYRDSIRIVRPMISAYEVSVKTGNLSNEARQWKAINGILIELNNYLMEANK